MVTWIISPDENEENIQRKINKVIIWIFKFYSYEVINVYEITEKMEK